jgi:hypothetical protein
MPWARARSSRISADQSRDPSNTASGLIAFTRIPYGPPSMASTRASWICAALEALYAPKSLPGARTFLDATKTRLPPSACCLSTLSACRETRKCPVALTSNERSQSPRAMRSIGQQWAMPALETTMSSPPYAARAESNACSTLRSLVTSIVRASALPPAIFPLIPSASAATPPSSRSVTTTWHPSRASCCAIERPMPLAAPDTIAILLASCGSGGASPIR